MRPPLLLCVGVGFAAGVAIHSVRPIALGGLAGVAAAIACLSCPVPGRLRLAGLVFVVGLCWPSPGQWRPVEAGALSGRVVGPVWRDVRGASVELEMTGGRRVRAHLEAPRDVSRAQATISPCDGVSFASSAARFRSGRYLVPWRRAGARGYRVVSRPCGSIWRIADSAHRSLRDRMGSGRGRGLVRAMIIGDRSGVLEADRDAFRRGGVAHVLAVSGLHLAVVVAIVFGVVRRALALALPGRGPERGAALAATIGAVAFTAMSGARIATIRAMLMASFMLSGLCLRRRPAASSALGFAVVAPLLWQPALARDAGFQLSVAATAVLIAMGGGTRRRGLVGRALAALALSLRASLATALVTAPIAGAHFGRVAPAGVLANLLVVPLVELGVIPLGLLGIALSWIHEGTASLVLDAAASLAVAGADVAATCGRWIEPVPAPTGIGPALASWMLALAVVRAPRRGAVALVAGAALAVVVPLVLAPRQPVRDQLRVTFVDVGQGDGAIIEWPGREVWVVDVGPRTPLSSPLVSLLESRSIERVSRVLITHDHPDHDGGLAQLREHFPEAEIVYAQPDPRDGATALPPLLGRQEVGSAAVWFLAPIYEGARVAEDPVLGANDNSIVMLVEYAGRRLLLTGDVEAEAEHRLLVAYPSIGAVDVLKVPHHGSATSSSPSLLERVRPRVAVISCGEGNSFGHPAPSVVERYQRAGAELLRTDVHGSVTVVVDTDGTMTVQTARKGR